MTGICNHEATHRDDKGAITYVGSGWSIPLMDIRDALECLILTEDNAPISTHVSSAALNVIVEHYGRSLADDWDDGVGPQPDIDCGQIAWAATQARNGDAREAAILLGRALSEYPDAVTALDIITDRLK